jgi:outer membrane protein
VNIAVLMVSAVLGSPNVTDTPPVSAEVLTLDHALELARANLPTLRQARAQTDQARGLHDEAVAAWYPTVTATLGYKRTTGNFAANPGLTPTGETLPVPSLTTYNYFSNSISASQLLWDFGQTSNKIAAAVDTTRSQQEAERTTLLQAELAVRTAFFTAAAQNALVSVAQVNLQNNDTHLAETRAFVKEGTQPDIALATAEANQANAVVQLITAKNAYATAKAKLTQAIGLQSPSIAYEVQGSPLPPVPDEEGASEKLVSEALRTRPEEAALQAQRRAAEANIKANGDAWFPTISATAAASDNGTNLGTTSWLGLTPNVAAGLLLSWSVNVGPYVPAEVRVARAQLASVDAQLDALHLQVRVDVETAQPAVAAARESLVAAKKGLDAANTQLRLANGRFHAGVGNAVEVSDAQLAADQSGGQAVQAQFNLDTSRAQLIEALGRI